VHTFAAGGCRLPTIKSGKVWSYRPWFPGVFECRFSLPDGLQPQVFRVLVNRKLPD